MTTIQATGFRTRRGRSRRHGSGPRPGCDPGPAPGGAGFGDLVEDPGGLIDLPRGFRYRVLSPEGATLSNGAPVPGEHDGMAAFAGRGNSTVLVRNHELTGSEAPAVPGTNPYDAGEPGGTTGIVVGPNRKEVSSFVTSSGTRKKLRRRRDALGTWLTCEEDRTTGHSYVFEVDPSDPENNLSKTPIRTWVSSFTRRSTSTRATASPTSPRTTSAAPRSLRAIRSSPTTRLPARA